LAVNIHDVEQKEMSCKKESDTPGPKLNFEREIRWSGNVTEFSKDSYFCCPGKTLESFGAQCHQKIQISSHVSQNSKNSVLLVKQKQSTRIEKE